MGERVKMELVEKMRLVPSESAVRGMPDGYPKKLLTEVLEKENAVKAAERSLHFEVEYLTIQALIRVYDITEDNANEWIKELRKIK